ncbi:acyl carrier protein [Streptomyces minutiscleroticus]|uniref:Acyl carrier protein n=1 Tax=Streptomyces minutiscleroticus TaxID=68238 RepID=A0A918NUH6_9ACTN|nr:acyl carrier protein [Streptomyces minutiscleroticus]GGX96383.1 acyl carrier protein [Streptomyces minutiscleroticus]
MSTAEVVSSLLAQRFGVAASELADETPLYRLRLDSLALEELRVMLEDTLDVDLDDIVLTSRDTVGRLMAAVEHEAAA